MTRSPAGGRASLDRAGHCYPCSHEPDHIIAVRPGGATVAGNLAYACFECNRAKGPNLSSIDPDTGAVTTLYSPRTQRWADHFHWNGAVIEPQTATGRATALLLRLNDEDRVTFRANLLHRGQQLGADSTD